MLCAKKNKKLKWRFTMNKDWNSIMFDDIGVKIQKVAKAIA